MNTDVKSVDAVGPYATAYAAHYSYHDLPLALSHYQGVISTYPDAPEADYSRMQIQNIVNTIISKQDLMDAQLELVRVHFEHEGTPDNSRPSVAIPHVVPA